jgi:hypothetical protein
LFISKFIKFSTKNIFKSIILFEISTTLTDAKTKYAIFYSTCTVNSFHNGSIIGNFILGFTRYQNLTRLNEFLNRTLVRKQLFGGTILSILFNSTTANTVINDTDYNVDYDESQSVGLSSRIKKLEQRRLVFDTVKRQKRIQNEFISSKSTDLRTVLLPQNGIHRYER